jgi:hypothetical protein
VWTTCQSSSCRFYPTLLGMPLCHGVVGSIVQFFGHVNTNGDLGGGGGLGTFFLSGATISFAETYGGVP